MPDEIITDLTQIQRATVAKEEENTAFRTFVKLEVELSDRRLNTLVSETTSEVWKHIDCRSCANCCRTRQPVFSRRRPNALRPTWASVWRRFAPAISRPMPRPANISRRPSPARFSTATSARSTRYGRLSVPIIPICIGTFAPASGKSSTMLKPARSSTMWWSA